MLRKVHKERAARSGRMAQGIVQRANTAGDRASKRKHDRKIGKGEPQHCGAAVDQPVLYELDVARHDIRVESPFDDIVRAREERHEIGPQCERGFELLLANGPGRTTPNGQIRVEQGRRLRRRDARSESVGPTVVAASPVGIVEALRRAVANRNVAREDSRPIDTLAQSFLHESNFNTRRS